jgi:hypothetical protein
MAEHSGRFGPTGEYKEIMKFTKNIVIIDICSESKRFGILRKISYMYHILKIMMNLR